MGNEAIALCKIVERQFVDDVLHGNLFMRPLSAFLSEENNAARRDPREGQSFVLQGDQFSLEVQLQGEFRPYTETLNLAYSHPDLLRANVFCMYALRASKRYEPIDTRNFKFGRKFVSFPGREFLRRVRAAAEQNGHRVQSSLVSYVDVQTYNGPLGIFRKSSEFSYQCEFRIALLPGTASDYFLRVGDLSDIASVGTLVDVTGEIPTKE